MEKEGSAYVFLRARLDRDKEDLFLEKIKEIENRHILFLWSLNVTERGSLRNNFFIYKGKTFTGLIWTCASDFPPDIKERVEAVFKKILQI